MINNTFIAGIFVGAIATKLLIYLFGFFGLRHGRHQAAAAPPTPPFTPPSTPPRQPLSKRFIRCHDSDADDDESLPLEFRKQGMIWVLESAKVPRVGGDDESQASVIEEDVGEADRTEIVEVCPVLKHGKIKNHKLILTDPFHDSCTTTIELLDCVVLAVSASELATRKWANRFPIKLESKRAAIYEGSKVCFIYLDTSWEKESWCKALQLSSCPERQMIKDYARSRGEFQHYTASIPERFSLLELFDLNPEVSEKGTKYHKPARIRHLLNRFGKWVPKSGRIPYTEKSSSSSNDMDQSDSLPPFHHGSKVRLNQIPDESALFFNLFISRLFFDVKRSTTASNYLKTQIERILSNLRFPSFFGRVQCVCLDVGNHPPLIRRVKVVNKEMSEGLTAEIDVEYSGGISFAFEVHQLGYEESNIEMNSKMNSGTDQMTVIDNLDLNTDGYFPDEPEHLESTTCKNVWSSTWKSFKTSVADKVLQDLLSLRVRVSLVCATMRLHIKPPPSDQLWFGFASMPEIEWNFESTVGGQRINNGAITSLLKELFENSIRESLVFPNRECICIPWMIDDQENWIPMTKAPFRWINQEAPVDFTDCNKNTPEHIPGSSLMDVREFNQELQMNELELSVSESDASKEAAPSQPNSSTGKIEKEESSSCRLKMVTAKTKEGYPSAKKNFRAIKKMVGASLKKCEKMKVNIFSDETPTLRSSEE